MENIVKLISKLKVEENLLRLCKVQLLTLSDIDRIKTEDDWQLELKINIEFDLAYDKLYLGNFNKLKAEMKTNPLILHLI